MAGSSRLARVLFALAGTLLLASQCACDDYEGRGWAGFASDGTIFYTRKEMWDRVAANKKEREEWYQKSLGFWDEQEASNKGVLLGYDSLHELDIEHSEQLLTKVLAQHGSKPAKERRALDCAAGVGRVTKNLLLKYYGTVDLLEPSQKLLSKGEEELKGVTGLPGVPEGHQASEFYVTGLQDFKFDGHKYDAIWIQWCLLYLTDDDITALLERAKAGLNPGGLIFVKENVSAGGFSVDFKDNSVTRDKRMFRKFFKAANLEVVANGPQHGYPADLYEVHLWALKPKGAPEAAKAEL